MNMEEKLALSVDEFCSSVGLSKSSYYRLVKQNAAPKGIKIGRRTVIPTTAIECWLAEAGKKPGTTSHQ